MASFVCLFFAITDNTEMNFFVHVALRGDLEVKLLESIELPSLSLSGIVKLYS